MYTWRLLTEVNYQPGTGEKNAIVLYYIHAKVLYSVLYLRTGGCKLWSICHS